MFTRLKNFFLVFFEIEEKPYGREHQSNSHPTSKVNTHHNHKCDCTHGHLCHIDLTSQLSELNSYPVHDIFDVKTV